MSIQSIDPDDEKNFCLSPGFHNATIISVTNEPNKAMLANPQDPKAGFNLVWTFEATDRATGQTGQLKSWNPRKKQSRSNNGPWLRQLGFDPANFDDEKLAGMSVVIETQLEDDNRNPGQQTHRIINVVPR